MLLPCRCVTCQGPFSKGQEVRLVPRVVHAKPLHDENGLSEQVLCCVACVRTASSVCQTIKLGCNRADIAASVGQNPITADVVQCPILPTTPHQVDDLQAFVSHDCHIGLQMCFLMTGNEVRLVTVHY